MTSALEFLVSNKSQTRITAWPYKEFSWTLRTCDPKGPPTRLARDQFPTGGQHGKIFCCAKKWLRECVCVCVCGCVGACVVAWVRVCVCVCTFSKEVKPVLAFAWFTWWSFWQLYWARIYIVGIPFILTWCIYLKCKGQLHWARIYIDEILYCDMMHLF